jgi:hypothetical protein
MCLHSFFVVTLTASLTLYGNLKEFNCTPTDKDCIDAIAVSVTYVSDSHGRPTVS